MDTALRAACGLASASRILEKYFDIEAYLQFKSTALRVEPASGTSTTAINLDTTGTATVTNNVALGTGHVKAIADTMKERNILV